MFDHARVKLTAYYLLIIVFVSGLFSAVIYNMLTRQIERLIRLQNERIWNLQLRPFQGDILRQ